MTQGSMTESELLAGLRKAGQPVAYRESDWLVPRAKTAAPKIVTSDVGSLEKAAPEPDAPKKAIVYAPVAPRPTEKTKRKDVLREEDYVGVIKAICKEFRVTPEHLVSSTRRSEIVLPRFAAMYLLRVTGYGRSLPRIGRILSRHHTTVLFGLRRAEYLMGENPAFLASMEMLHLALTGRPLPKSDESLSSQPKAA